MHPSPSTLATAVILAAVVALIATRPRMLLQPLVLGFAMYSWVKLVLSLPVHWRESLVAKNLETQASALHLHAQTAAALWSTSADFRPAAREIFERVATGYGIGLRSRNGAVDMHPSSAANANEMASAFGAQSVAQAAAAVTATKGAAISKLPEKKNGT